VPIPGLHARLGGVRFRHEHEVRRAVRAAFGRHRARIAAALPAAEVEHIGATAVPGALTKGDLDLLVRVPRPEFAAAVAYLESLYEVNQPENWNGGFASFRELPEREVPVGVQLVVSGGIDDRMLISWRDRLLNDPEMLARYNDFKRRHTDVADDAYIEAKAEFIESVLGGGIGGSGGPD